MGQFEHFLKNTGSGGIIYVILALGSHQCTTPLLHHFSGVAMGCSTSTLGGTFWGWQDGSVMLAKIWGREKCIDRGPGKAFLGREKFRGFPKIHRWVKSWGDQKKKIIITIIKINFFGVLYEAKSLENCVLPWVADTLSTPLLLT